jgi:hypothetical protein
MEPLIILANLGRVRIVRHLRAGDDPQRKQHLVEALDSTTELRPEAIHEVVTDHAGRFPQSGPVDRLAGMSYGEEHHLEAELETRALERIAARIAEVVTAEGFPRWRLTAPQPILPALVAALPVGVREALAHSEGGDFTRLPLEELERHFFAVS